MGEQRGGSRKEWVMRERRGVGHGGAERREQRGGSREEWVMRSRRGVGHEGAERCEKMRK